jgi:hypothetical protein
MELSGITDDTEGILYQIGAQLYHPSRGIPVAFLLWSGIAGGQGKQATDHLMDALNKHALAYVFTSARADNPKTGNVIQVFTAAIKHETYRACYLKMRADKFNKAT